jgi:hypothetical protein
MNEDAMGNFDAPQFIEHSTKLIDIFGYWPSFHDAEVIDLSLTRGEVRPEENLYIFPILTVTIHLWELTNETDEKGFLKCIKHTLAVLRFRNVEEITLAGFNHQNAIYGLMFGTEARGNFKDGTPLPPYTVVEFEPAHGCELKFKCFGVEVVSAHACNENGKIDMVMDK